MGIRTAFFLFSILLVLQLTSVAIILTPERVLPTHNGNDAYAPAAAFGGDVFIVVWQSGRLLPGDLRLGPKYHSAIVGCRVRSTGEVIDTIPFIIADTVDLKQSPRIIYGHNQFLVVWQDLRNGKDWDVYAARVTPDGTVQDKNGVLVSGGKRNQALPRAAWDGSNYNIVWQDGRSEKTYETYLARLSPNGEILDPSGVLVASGVSHVMAPIVAPTNTVGRVFVFSISATRTFAGVYQYWQSPTTGIFVSDGIPDAQPVYSIPFNAEPRKMPLGLAPAAIAKGSAGYMISWRTDVTNSRVNNRTPNNAAFFDLFGIRIHDFCYSLTGNCGEIVLNPDVSWDGCNYVNVWHERVSRNGVQRHEIVAAVAANEYGEVIDSAVLVSGSSAIGAMEACVASDAVNGGSLIAYERMAPTSSVPISIAYRMSNADKSKGYLSVSVVDSVAQEQVKTGATLKLIRSSIIIGTSQSSSGILRIAADSGSGYFIDVEAPGFAAKRGIPVYLEGGKTLALTVNLQRLAVTGIRMVPDTLFMFTNAQKSFLLYRVHSDGTILPADSDLSIVWASLNSAVASVSQSGVVSTTNIAGECIIVAAASSTSFSDSAYVKSVMAYQVPHFHWSLNEGMGSSAADVSGNGNTATLRGGATWVQGRFGSALFFDGVDDYLSTIVAQSNPLPFSLSMWFSTNANAGVLIGFGSTSTGQSTSYDRDIKLTSTGALSFRCYPGNNRTITSPSSYNDGEWHHLVATLSSAGMFLYVDGAPVVSDTATKSAESFTGYWKIGYSNAPYFQGMLDDIRVYNTALSSEDILLLYGDTTTYAVTQEYDEMTKIKPDIFLSPNPFNAVVNISVNGWRRGEMRLDVFDINGKKVASLSSQIGENASRIASQGEAKIVRWNASAYPSGIYFVSLSGKGFELKRKAVLVK